MSEQPQKERLDHDQDEPQILSIFRADTSQQRFGQLSPSMTLGQFYDAYVLPVWRTASSTKTTAIDQAALNHWASLTGDPPLDAISAYDTAAFVERVKLLPGKNGRPISPNTIRKHCTALQFILDRAGPGDDRRLRNTARLIDRPPGFQRPKYRKPPTIGALSLLEIGRWMRVCDQANTPAKMRPVVPTKWWRALVTFLYNTALRIETTLYLEWDMLAEDGWLTIPPEIYKGREHGGEFYVNRHARAAIESIRHWRFQEIFPWKNWPNSASWLHEQRRRLWKSAKINRPGIGFHGLRKACETALAGRNELVARFVAGHVAGDDILANHYVDHRQIVGEHLEQLPQPTWRHDDNPNQMVFDWAS